MTEGNMNTANATLGRIAARVRDTIAQGGLDPTLDLILDHAQSRFERETAMRAWRNLRANRSLSSEELTVLEQLVLPLHRPMFDVAEDSIRDAPAPWSDLWQFQSQLEHAIRAVGILKISSGQDELFNSTAVLIARNLVMTNRHVAEQCFSGVGVSGLKPLPERAAAIDFHQERWASDPQNVAVISARMIHPFWDIAVLEIEPVDRVPITLWGTEPPFLQEMRVMSIGYPAMNPKADFEFQGRLFEERFNIKRGLPGVVVGYREVLSYQNRTDALVFDSSTLGINSGAAVVDLDTGKLLGVQFVNAYLDGNFAVPCHALALDPWVRQLGIAFEPAPSSTDPPPWHQSWTSLGESLAQEVEASEPMEPEYSPTAALLGGDWYERCSDEDIVEALRRAPSDSRAILSDVLPPQQANELIEALGAPGDKSRTVWPSPRAELPEIVLLPDFLGCHLSHTGTALSRIWLDPQRIFSQDVLRHLTLNSDGVREVDGSAPMTIGPLLRLQYGFAMRSWRRAGFVVHPFAYDWRKRAEHSATRLHLYLETLRLDRPDARFVLVAHGLGGLVAASYAARFANWRQQLDRAIFVGVPLLGCLMPVDALSGEFAVFEKLRLLSGGDRLDVMRMASSMPGLLDLLPEPRAFENAEQLFMQTSWPEASAPRQRALQGSLNLKAAVARSPLLERVTVILSTEHGTQRSLAFRGRELTSGGFEYAGDGVVSAHSAYPAWLDAPAFRVAAAHTELLQDPATVAAVVDMLSMGQCRLEPYRSEQLSSRGARALLPPAPMARLTAESLDAISRRLRSGRLSLHDGGWLLSPHLTPPPS